MKLILSLILLTMLTTTAKSQFYLGWEGGRSSKNYTVALKLGYELPGDLLIEGAVKTHTDQINPAYFTLSGGYQFWTTNNMRLIPLVGYCRSIVSLNYDKRAYNQSLVIGGLRLQLNKWYTEVNYTQQTPMLSLGFLLNKKNHENHKSF